MCKKLKIRSILMTCLVTVTFATLQGEAGATIISFERITSNAPSDIAGQLSAIVSSVDANHVKFEFHNSAVIASSITDIYFDDGGPNPPGILNSLSSIVDYNTLFEIGAYPANLPAGYTLTPAFSADFAAQAKTIPPSIKTNGVDNSTDYVSLIFLLKPSMTFDNVIAALDNQSLRVGLHIQSIVSTTERDRSDSFVSIPEPATICLLALGSLIFTRRKK